MTGPSYIVVEYSRQILRPLGTHFIPCIMIFSLFPPSDPLTQTGGICTFVITYVVEFVCDISTDSPVLS